MVADLWKKAFLSGSVVTTQRGKQVRSPPLSYKSRKKRGRKRKTMRGFFFSNDQTPRMSWSLISPINTDFNHIFENYYEYTCCPTFGDFILRPSNCQKSLFIFKNCWYICSSFHFTADNRQPRQTLLRWPPKCFPPYPMATKGQQILTNSKQCII